MKLKNLLLALTLLVSTVALAQEKGDFNGFAGLTYPLESDSNLGITAGVEYVFANNFSIAPSFTYYFEDQATLTQLDFDLRYYLGNDNFNFFLTGGLSIVKASTDLLGVTISASETGFAGGVGALISMGDSIDLITVLKYNVEMESVIPTVGLSFGF